MRGALMYLNEILPGIAEDVPTFCPKCGSLLMY